MTSEDQGTPREATEVRPEAIQDEEELGVRLQDAEHIEPERTTLLATRGTVQLRELRTPVVVKTKKSRSNPEGTGRRIDHWVRDYTVGCTSCGWHEMLRNLNEARRLGREHTCSAE